MKFTSCSKYNFVECGVGDGVTTFFSLREINNNNKIKENFSMHLYDSWSEMKKDNLLKEELSNVGKYFNLNIELTKSNLKEFEKKIIFHQGYIPESFSKVPNSPDEIVFLHIDLNSAIPTKATLDFFFPKITHGGIILFDDYGWEGYDETKQVIDKYFYNKSGMLLKLPTGQAIYFNN